MDSEFSEKFEVNVKMHQESVLSPSFVIVVGVVTKFTKVCVLCELMYAEF